MDIFEKLQLPLSRSSGKSTLSKAIISKYPNFERLSIDANVHAKHGLYNIDFPAEKYPEYQLEADAEVRARLFQLLENGERDAVLDRALYLKEDRDYFKRVVEEKGGRWILVYFRPASKQVIWQRIQSRRQKGIDADSAFEIPHELLDEFWDGFEVPEDEGEIVVDVVESTVAESISLPPTPPEGTPDTSDLEIGRPISIYAETPSSTVVEFGDKSKQKFPSAVRTMEEALQSYNRSRSRPTRRDGHESARSNTPTPKRPRSATRSRSTQRNDRGPVARDRAVTVDDKVSRFLNSIAPPLAVDAKLELLAENRSLLQRIAALQCTERELLKDNQKLTGQLSSFKKHYETLNEIERQRVQLEEHLLQLTPAQPRGDPFVQLTNEDAISWFATRTKAWHAWADGFAHHDPHHIQTGLHPLQLRELCEGVKDFVVLTEDGNLPPELLRSVEKSDVKTAQILLHGMLASFIVTETLHSPFWVFAAIAACGLELESPCMPRANSMSPIGFRMDLAMWNNVAPLRSARLMPPKTAFRAPEAPGNSRRLPPLVTSIQPLSLDTAVQPTTQHLSDQKLPAKQEMENLYGLLSNVQQNHNNTHIWRSHLMRMFCEGGITLEPGSVKGEERRQLAEARQGYAKKLKSRFLSGPARFLLHDQDASGIEQLERRLVNEIDMALSFSCQIWSRQDPLRFRGLQELTVSEFKASSTVMELCQAQAPLFNQQHEQQQPEEETESPPAYHDGHSVIMVVQPAIDSVSITPEGDAGLEEQSSMWAKALVMVTEPAPSALTTNAPSSKAPAPTPTPTPTTAIGPPVPPKELAELLPKVTFLPPTKPSSTKAVTSPPPPPSNPGSIPRKEPPALSCKSSSTNAKAAST
ncbi:hypothetical protein B0T19DRAFT_441006 [Cercophora scortea]|uniref:Uncharacterized protein n=1 Tax=Cercophora scortea TaxID=314031 RepID=A0AAE0IL08_9PEZI|nr:hypothetical protein B0T19DRAFT_441006 [Cercophora scortea]